MKPFHGLFFFSALLTLECSEKVETVTTDAGSPSATDADGDSDTDADTDRPLYLFAPKQRTLPSVVVR